MYDKDAFWHQARQGHLRYQPRTPSSVKQDDSVSRRDVRYGCLLALSNDKDTSGINQGHLLVSSKTTASLDAMYDKDAFSIKQGRKRLPARRTARTPSGVKNNKDAS